MWDVVPHDAVESLRGSTSAPATHTTPPISGLEDCGVFCEDSFMATVTPKTKAEIRYPTSDGRPMAETDLHRDIMVDTIQSLDYFFAPKPMVYVSGNLLLYYVQGNKRKHVSPDVFVVFGVAKKKRDYYLTWEEGKNPSVVIEITSSPTQREDIKKKFELYRDVLEVKEYFLFDPRSDYLKPRLTGYRLSKGDYVPIPLVQGRMPS